MADGEDPSVKPMQPPHTYCPVDRTARISERPGQLPYRDNPMLSLRKFCEGIMSST
jgi:hypothetical protein